jgi:DNA-binding MarR family transcriptional regulator
MSAQSANQVLHVLVAAKLVRREPDPEHGRIGRTRLTDRGHAVLAACDRVVDAVEAEMLGSLIPKQRPQLLRNLKACLKALDPSYRG